MKKIFRMYSSYIDDSESLVSEQILEDNAKQRFDFVTHELGRDIKDDDFDDFCNEKTSEIIIQNYGDWDCPQSYKVRVITIQEEIAQKEEELRKSLQLLNYLK